MGHWSSPPPPFVKATYLQLVSSPIRPLPTLHLIQLHPPHPYICPLDALHVSHLNPSELHTWSELNHLQLNVTKTGKLVVGLKRIKSPVVPFSIHGVNVDIVENYKLHVDNKLDWARNTEALHTKGQSRLYFLRRLRPFNICPTMLKMFYESAVSSATLFAVSRLRFANPNRLDKLICKAGDIIGWSWTPWRLMETDAPETVKHSGKYHQPPQRIQTEAYGLRNSDQPPLSQGARFSFLWQFIHCL